MTKNEIKYLLYDFFYSLSASISSIFIALFIWQEKQDITLIYKYHIALFIVIPIVGFISSYIAKAVSPKVSILLSFIARAITLLSILYLKDAFIAHPEIFGAITAISIGLYAITNNSTFQKVISPDRIAKATAIDNALGKVIALTTPLIGSFWIYLTGDYSGIFVLSIIILVVSFLVVSITFIPKVDVSWNLRPVLNLKAHPDFLKLMLFRFVNGIRYGVVWSIFGILTLFLLKEDLPAWGVTTSAMSLVGILGALVYAKYFSKKAEVVMFTLTGFAYAFASILFVANFNFQTLVVFLIFNSLAQSFLSSSAWPIFIGIIEEDPDCTNYLDEYYAIAEIPLSLGRLLPLIILFITNADMNYDPVLRIIFLVIGTVPLLSASILKKTNYFRHETV